MFRLRVDDRTELRLPEAGDVESAFSLIMGNYEHIHQWMGWLTEKMGLEDIRKFYARCAESFENNGSEFALLIWFDGQIIGGTGLHQIDRSSRSAETGYWMARESEGHGIMARSVEKLLDYVFVEMKLNRVSIKCAPDNVKSRRIPERLGFIREGTEREAAWLHTRYIDHVVYSMLAAEWKARSEKLKR